MPKNNSIKKVLVIGSGPIVIGQAAEFDYAGTQACRSLKEEGIEVVLVNSNPATIMTDKQIADKVYIEPLTTEVLKKIIKKEEPDSILPTLGGQAALNLAMELDDIKLLRNGADEKAFLNKKKAALLARIAELTRQIAIIDGHLSGEKPALDAPVLVKTIRAVTVATSKKRIESYDELFDLMPEMGAEMERLGCECVGEAKERLGR